MKLGSCVIHSLPQACTELPMICATNNMTDMFPPVSYDPTEYCQQKWGVSMRRGWTSTQFWGVGTYAYMYMYVRGLYSGL